jgi:hypothetical protein
MLPHTNILEYAEVQLIFSFTLEVLRRSAKGIGNLRSHGSVSHIIPSPIENVQDGLRADINNLRLDVANRGPISAKQGQCDS